MCFGLSQERLFCIMIISVHLSPLLLCSLQEVFQVGDWCQPPQRLNIGVVCWSSVRTDTHESASSTHKEDTWTAVFFVQQQSITWHERKEVWWTFCMRGQSHVASLIVGRMIAGWYCIPIAIHTMILFELIIIFLLYWPWWWHVSCLGLEWEVFRSKQRSTPPTHLQTLFVLEEKFDNWRCPLRCLELETLLLLSQVWSALIDVISHSR